jgi:hypothetical protein
MCLNIQCDEKSEKFCKIFENQTGPNWITHATPSGIGASQITGPDERTMEPVKKASGIRLPALGTLKRYSKALEYEYRVKIVALVTLK